MLMVVLLSWYRMKSNLLRDFLFPPLATQKLHVCVCFQDQRCGTKSSLFLLFVEELRDGHWIVFYRYWWFGEEEAGVRHDEARQGVCLGSKYTYVYRQLVPCVDAAGRNTVTIVVIFTGSPVIGRIVTSDCNMGIIFDDSCLTASLCSLEWVPVSDKSRKPRKASLVFFFFSI